MSLDEQQSIPGPIHDRIAVLTGLPDAPPDCRYCGSREQLQDRICSTCWSEAMADQDFAGLG